MYGLTGRLTVVGGVNGAASSLGSRGGSFRVGLVRSQNQLHLELIDEIYLAVVCSRVTPLALVAPLLCDMVSADGELNSAGVRGVKDERMEVLRLSRSRASRALVQLLSGELPLRRWDGRADFGLGPNGGEEPDAIALKGDQQGRKSREQKKMMVRG